MINAEQSSQTNKQEERDLEEMRTEEGQEDRNDMNQEAGAGLNSNRRNAEILQLHTSRT